MSKQKDNRYSQVPVEGWQHKSAFVIQFLYETDIASGRIEGRVEHVQSNRCLRFSTLDELLGFVDRVVKDVQGNRD